MTRSPSVRYCHILTFSENRLLVPAFSSTADGQRGTPRRPSADGVTRLPSPLPYVFHLQGIAPKLLTHRVARGDRRARAGRRGLPDGAPRAARRSAAPAGLRRGPLPQHGHGVPGDDPLLVRRYDEHPHPGAGRRDFGLAAGHLVAL